MDIQEKIIDFKRINENEKKSKKNHNRYTYFLLTHLLQSCNTNLFYFSCTSSALYFLTKTQDYCIWCEEKKKKKSKLGTKNTFTFDTKKMKKEIRNRNTTEMQLWTNIQAHWWILVPHNISSHTSISFSLYNHMLVGTYWCTYPIEL